MKNIVSILMAILIILFNIGMNMNTHYCGGHAVETSFSIGHQNLRCGMPGMDIECTSGQNKDDSLISNNCCENQHILFELEDEMQVKWSQKNIHPIFVVSFIHNIIQSIRIDKEFITHFIFHSPPLPDRDINILYQVFII